MGRRIYVSSKYKKDLKRAAKRGKDIDKLDGVVDLLQQDIPLPTHNLDHALSSNWKGHRECHLEPDWLLIYKKQDNNLLLTRTGTHNDLFS